MDKGRIAKVSSLLPSLLQSGLAFCGDEVFLPFTHGTDLKQFSSTQRKGSDVLCSKILEEPKRSIMLKLFALFSMLQSLQADLRAFLHPILDREIFALSIFPSSFFPPSSFSFSCLVLFNLQSILARSSISSPSSFGCPLHFPDPTFQETRHPSEHRTKEKSFLAYTMTHLQYGALLNDLRPHIYAHRERLQPSPGAVDNNALVDS
jgi:hypothetical protein